MPPPPAGRTPLYDLHAGPGGVIHFAPNCAEGHQLGVAFIERMWALDAARDGQHEVAPPVPSPQRTRPVASSDALTPEPKPSVPSPDRVAASSPTLSALRALHLGSLRQGPKRATPATRDRTYALDLLIDVLGDRPIGDLTPQDAIAFADVLAVWPRRKQHLPGMVGLSARAVALRAKRDKLPPIAPGTQHKHLMHVNAFMNWAIESGDLADNPFRYLDTSRYIRDERGRVRKKKDIFSQTDLKTIFDPVHLRTHNAPHKYWAPLIGFLTGMRVNEVAQLYLCDVHRKPFLQPDGTEHDVLVFDIGAHQVGQSVKTTYGIRDIPVPRVLLDLGFEDYLDDVRTSGAAELFPGLNRHQEGGPGKTVSQWFNGLHLRETCGITSPRKTLHSFRHNLTTLMERCNIPDSIMQAINGHSPGEGVDRRSYIADATVLECQAVLDALPFPKLGLVPYAPGRFAQYLEQAAAEREREARAREEGQAFRRKKGPRPLLPIPQ